MTHTTTGIWAIVLLVCACSICNADNAQPVTPAQTFDLETPGFKLRFRPDRAWTFSQITYQDHLIGIPRGFYGFVLATGPAQFIGTGHTEGGVEVVTSAVVQVDGQPQPTAAGKITCNQATVTKHSLVGDFEQVTAVHLFPERIEIETRVTALQDTFVELMYPFMFCWSPTTTAWMAKLDNGQIVDGTFNSDNGWQLQQDAQWTAIYEPNMHLAIMCDYDDTLPPGQLHKHAYWDRDHYHKQYYQSLFRQNVPKGQVYEYRVTLHALPDISPDQWKQDVIAHIGQQHEN